MVKKSSKFKTPRKYNRGKNPNSRLGSPFQKGHKINVGRVISEKTRKKIGEANKLRQKNWMETQQSNLPKNQRLEQALNYEELWNINNGETLCENCHKETDTYGKHY